MRLKHKKWANAFIEEHLDKISLNPIDIKGHWQERFKSCQPLQLEIGMGKGKFLLNMARLHPETNFMGLEIERTVAAIALKKILLEKLPNLTLVNGDAADIATYLEKGSVDRIYLNFSDPWPKNRHEKRRLTYKKFLANYQQILKPFGKIEFKTDNMNFFEYSLTSFNNYGMIFDGIWLDYHHSLESQDNVETEYERRFSDQGQPIYKLIAHFDHVEEDRELLD